MMTEDDLTDEEWERLKDRPATEDWVVRVITTPHLAELYWKRLVAMDIRLAALALNANTAFCESY